MTEDTWGNVQDDLQKAVGANNYRNWIEPLEFSDLKDGVATFFVPTNFMGNWVSRNFGDQILQLHQPKPLSLRSLDICKTSRTQPARLH